MARRKNHPEAVRAKGDLADRLRAIRAELFGERGAPELARRLGLPIRTWYNYENGVTLPAEVLLRFIELTSVEPLWLLHGRGPRYRPPSAPEGEPVPVTTLLRTVLNRLEREPVRGPSSNGNGPFGGAGGQGGPFLDDEGAALGVATTGPSVVATGAAMAPIVADGARVGYHDRAEGPEELDGELVVVWVEGQPLVRWFQISGRFALLRAENASVEPGVILWPLGDPRAGHPVRRVLWISTPH